MGKKRKNVAESASDGSKKLHSKKKPVKALGSLSKVTEVSVATKSPKKKQLVENPGAVEKPKEQNLPKQPTYQNEEVKKNIVNRVQDNNNGSTGNQQQIGEQTKEQHTMEDNGHIKKSSNQCIGDEQQLDEQTIEQHTMEDNSHINKSSNQSISDQQQLGEQTKEQHTVEDNSHINNSSNQSIDNQQQRGEQGKEKYTVENNSHAKESSNQSICNQKQLGEQTRELHTMVNNGQTNNKKMGELGGVVFLCNAKTKSDCFRYMVLGFPDSRRELVMSIKPDLRLFLYDYHLKVLHGIYRASSPGGMRLEPAAFNGGFPAQVRFKVDQDCAPLPFSSFCGLLQNFDARTNMVQPELSVEIVEKLASVFLQTRLNPRPMNPGANPNMARTPLVPGQTFPHPQPGAFFNQANCQFAAGLVRAYGSPLLPPGDPFATELVRTYGPRGIPPVHPQVPFDDRIPSSATNPQAHFLQPHFSAPANPVPALNPNMGGFDIAHPNPQRAPNLQPQLRPPFPPPFMFPAASSQMGLRHGSQPRLLAPADPATMPISHKYALDLNLDAERPSSQRCDQANSNSADTLQIPNKDPFPSDSKLSEKNHAPAHCSHLPRDLATLAESIDLPSRKVPHPIEAERVDPPSRHMDRVGDRPRISLFDQSNKTDVNSLPVSSRYAFDGPSLKYR